jgi:hypothetical protein
MYRFFTLGGYVDNSMCLKLGLSTFHGNTHFHAHLMTGPYIVFAMSIFINKWTWPEQYRVQTLVCLVCVQIEKLIKCVIPNRIMLFCIMFFCCTNMFWIKTVHFCLDFPLIIFFSIRHSMPLRSWQRSAKNQPKILIQWLRIQAPRE